MKEYNCDKCGSKENVSATVFKYRYDSGLRGNRAGEARLDMCEKCIIKTIKFLRGKELINE